MADDDRRLEAVLARLDAVQQELARINRRLERLETLDRLVDEVHDLNRSLQTLAYAALGRRGPDVRRE